MYVYGVLPTRAVTPDVMQESWMLIINCKREGNVPATGCKKNTLPTLYYILNTKYYVLIGKT